MIVHCPGCGTPFEVEPKIREVELYQSPFPATACTCPSTSCS